MSGPHLVYEDLNGRKLLGIQLTGAMAEKGLLDTSGRLPITWNPVTSSHPTLGVAGSVEVVIYQFVLEGEDFEFTANLDSETTNFTVPAEVVSSGEEIKIELIVRDSTYNQVATEACTNVI